jgi:hypothetical protein
MTEVAVVLDESNVVLLLEDFEAVYVVEATE